MPPRSAPPRVNDRPAHVTRFDCGECGMNVTATDYHPYWFCVMFKAGFDPRSITPGDLQRWLSSISTEGPNDE